MKPHVWSICSDLKSRELLWTLNNGNDPVPAYVAAAIQREMRKRKN